MFNPKRHKIERQKGPGKQFKVHDKRGYLEYEGELNLVDSTAHGIGKEYFKSGLKVNPPIYREGTYNQGLLSGPMCKEYSFDGKLTYEGGFLFNKRHSKGISYNPDQSVAFDGLWHEGDQVGSTTIIGQSLKRRPSFEIVGGVAKGKKFGEGKDFWENGKLKFEGEFLDG